MKKEKIRYYYNGPVKDYYGHTLRNPWEGYKEAVSEKQALNFLAREFKKQFYGDETVHKIIKLDPKYLEVSIKHPNDDDFKNAHTLITCPDCGTQYYDDEQTECPECGRKLEESNMRETEELYYPKLEITVAGEHHASTWGDYGGEPEYWDDEEIEVEWTYEADKSDIEEALFEIIINEDPHFFDNMKNDEEINDYLKNNFGILFEDKYEQLLDYFEDKAREDAEENYEAPDLSWDRYDESLKESLSFKDLESKIREILNKYNDESTSKINLIEFDDGTFIEEFDDGDIDFSKLKTYKPEKDIEGANKPIASFMISGGLNGSGEWDNYLEDIKKVFQDLEDTLNIHIELQKLTSDIPDDVWTAEVFLYKKDNLEEDIEKHDELNPKLFDNEELKPEVKEAIQNIADTFIKELHEDGIKFNLKDIVLVGSNVSYNYTKDSDLDIHIIADSEGLECPDDLYPLLYSAYRSIFNKNYDISIKGIPAEIYVEIDQPAGISNGVYSLKDGWIKKPEPKAIPELNKEEFDKLFSEWEEKYNQLLSRINEDLSDDIYDFIEDLYDLRKEAIAKEGEYGLGNLVFKEFRNRGYLDNLKELRKQEKGKELSLENLDNNSDEAKLNEENSYITSEYRRFAGIDESIQITEDNIDNYALNRVSAYENYDISELKDLLLKGGTTKWE